MAGGKSEIIDNWLVINSIDNGYLSIDNGYLSIDNGYLLVDNGYLLVDNGYLLVDNGRGRNSQYINVRHAPATLKRSGY